MTETRQAENPTARDICIRVTEPVIWDKDVAQLRKSMPIKYARQIKQWRVGVGPDDPNTHSWRSVATIFYNTYPEFSEQHNILSGNQISGMYLCDAAMIKLRETIDQGWN